MIEKQNTPVALEETAVQELAGRLRGALLRPSDAGYEQARQVYNAMINKHPALIVRSKDVADVMAAVTFAREHELTLAVRCGGHNGPGLGICDDGLVIDLSNPIPLVYPAGSANAGQPIPYSSFVQLIRSADSANGTPDGDFGTLGLAGLGSTGTGFGVGFGLTLSRMRSMAARRSKARCAICGLAPALARPASITFCSSARWASIGRTARRAPSYRR